MEDIRLRLPATSANLGPGFDALGLAMALYLEIDASVAAAGQKTTIEASGRNADLVGRLEANLMLETYRLLAPAGPELRLVMENQIPLGMGCGSSAAALLAGVELASHFGGLCLTRQEVLEIACLREGHPDNVAACFYGGMTVSAMMDGKVTTASFRGDPAWKLLLALPASSLATKEARALLPDTYSRADAVANVQATALLVAAFAQGRPELLLEATRDRLHQPYRSEVCPLLPALLPLVGNDGIYSVTLSGAGPSVLLISGADSDVHQIAAKIAVAASPQRLEIIETTIVAPFLGNLKSGRR